jgi:hypothetical protein
MSPSSTQFNFNWRFQAAEGKKVKKFSLDFSVSSQAAPVV